MNNNNIIILYNEMTILVILVLFSGTGTEQCAM